MAKHDGCQELDCSFFSQEDIEKLILCYFTRKIQKRQTKKSLTKEEEDTKIQRMVERLYIKHENTTPTTVTFTISSDQQEIQKNAQELITQKQQQNQDPISRQQKEHVKIQPIVDANQQTVKELCAQPHQTTIHPTTTTHPTTTSVFITNPSACTNTTKEANESQEAKPLKEIQEVKYDNQEEIQSVKPDVETITIFSMKFKIW